MAIEIIKSPAKILNTKCVTVTFPVSDALLAQIAEAKGWVADDANKALGLAAPQVNSNLSWFVMRRGDEVIECINPKIIGRLGHISKTESCFSEECAAVVRRSKKVVVEYQDINGDVIKEELFGQDSQCFQHEEQHTRGLLINQVGKTIK